MECSAVEKGLSSYLDEQEPDIAGHGISLHLASCRMCSTRYEEMRSVRRTLQRMPRPAVPAAVTLGLRITGSRELLRRRNPHTFWALFRMRLNQFLRPLMVPACGGLLSSVLLFSVFVDTLDWRLTLSNDVPLGLYTSVSVDETSPFQFTGGDLLLQLTVSEKGTVTNCEAPNGSLTRDDLRKIGNWLLFTSFIPATKYGQPTSGKVLVSFHRINVRG